jgi:hypothetical protein
MTQAQRNAIPSPAMGLLVFQTDGTPGHYAWDGASWLLMPAGTPSVDWKLSGNTGTNPGTGVGQNYFGTTDNRALVFATFGIERFRIPTANQVHAGANGTAALPFYSWGSDSNTGMYRIGTDILGLSTSGIERLRIAANGFVGINTAAPTEALHVTGNMRVNGALMPNNLAGTSGQLLKSAGPGAPPTWGANLTNVTDITRYILTGPNIDPATTYSLTVTIPGVTTQSTGIITITGNWSTDIFDEVTIHNIEMRTNEVRFAISNNTIGTTYPAMQYNLTIIR